MDKRVQLAITIMKEDLQRELSLGELAGAVGFSVSYFHHVFKSEVGMTPANYLRSLRMERARELLETTLLSPKEILIKVGIKDKSNFERGFKKAYGVTPHKYRATALRIDTVKESLDRGKSAERAASQPRQGVGKTASDEPDHNRKAVKAALTGGRF